MIPVHQTIFAGADAEVKAMIAAFKRETKPGSDLTQEVYASKMRGTR